MYLSIRTTNTRADAGGLMRRVIGRRGKGGGHGMLAGGWIDASKITGPAERREMQKRLGIRLAKELKKNPEKIGRIELRPRTKEEEAAEQPEIAKKTP
jgi:hypothetical protein